jgi:predicted neutral ceramidase superfamily lipid hydrolase
LIVFWSIIGGLLFGLATMLLRRTEWRKRWRFNATSPSGRSFLAVATLVALLTLLVALISMRYGASTRDVLSALSSLLLIYFVVVLVRRGRQGS